MENLLFLGNFFSLHIQNWEDPHKHSFQSRGSVYEVPYHDSALIRVIKGLARLYCYLQTKYMYMYIYSLTVCNREQARKATDMHPKMSAEAERMLSKLRVSRKNKFKSTRLVNGYNIVDLYLNPLYWENPKPVLLQTVKTQMKCSIMLHFIRVFTVCKVKKRFSDKKCNIFSKL